MAATSTQLPSSEIGSLPAAWHRVQLLAEMIVDPAGAALFVQKGQAWLLPWITGGIVVVFVSLAMLPFTQEAIRVSLPEGTGALQAERMLASVYSYQRAGAYLSPLLLLIKWAIFSGVVFTTCVLLDIRVTYRTLLNLISHCGILLVTQDVLAYVVIRFREGPIRSQSDLLVSFGLDLIFKPSSAAVAVVLNYFSALNVWFIAACALAIASVGRTSRVRGFLAVAPLVAFQLILVVGFALLQPS